MLTPVSKMPGLDGQKMSKSYGNTITLREEPESVEKKIRTMPTDPARVRRNDPGDPDNCPVWEFHKIYSNEEVQNWVKEGCTSAGIGCLECKQPVIECVIKEQKVFRDNAQEYIENPELVKNIVNEGSEHARDVARETMEDVRQAMGLNYR